MPGFDVLSKDLAVFESHFIEASAGTGKTFTIENIVLRLLIEGLSINEILVVTFTKAATLELKRRIRETIEKAIKSETLSFLQKKLLSRSLSLFDECQIQTIHGFCAHALFSDLMDDPVKESYHEELNAMVKDYLRTELESLIPVFQMDKLMRRYQYNLEALIKDLLKIALTRTQIQINATYQEQKKEIFQEIEKLKETHLISIPFLFEDLLNHAQNFKGMKNNKKEMKEEIVAELKRFSLLFDKEVDLDFIYVQEMQEENRLKKGLKDLSLHYPDLFPLLQKHIFSRLNKMQDDLHIFAHLAEGVRKHLLKEESIILPDDLLLSLEKKVKDPEFARKIREKYRAVLVDEFQDTDRLQWTIFSTLFNQKDFKAPLYLVGDPKQSIYRFRGADIYTYLEAKKSFKNEQQKTLKLNYRSEPHLVQGLNTLFAPLNPFLILPKTNDTLLCPELGWDERKSSTDWQDGKGSIHFVKGENEEEFFSFIIDEIKKLKMPLEECAVLVKDRFQAERFKKFAALHHLNATSRKRQNLSETKAYHALYELIEGIIPLKKKGAVEKILAGPLFAYDMERIQENKEKETEKLFRFKEILQKEGILSLFKTLNEDPLFDELLSRVGGDELYLDLLQLVELLAERSDPHSYLDFLRKMEKMSDEDPLLQTRNVNLGKECIPLYTIHGSKGLEFDVVFALGLAFSALEKKELIFDAEKRIYSFSEKEFENHKKEIDSEKMRLFYVAATRAKKRVYFPYIENDKRSPISLYLEKAPLETLHSPHITSSVFEPTEIAHGEANESPMLLPPPALQLEFKYYEMTSYSQMVTSTVEPIEYPDNILPVGKETGILLHKILNELPFEKITCPERMVSLFSHLTEETPLQPWNLEIAQMLYNVFHAPLPFFLRDVDPHKVIKEMEFLYLSQKEGAYIKGFIDCVFEYNNKIYFIDWKSNYLADYSQKSLEKALKDHNYFLQNEIYREAIQRYASLFDLEVGGSFYIFLRGISPHSTNGIFFNNFLL